MKLLVISQMFPCKRHPTSAIFFANLLEELALMVDELTVITPRPYVPKFFTKFKKSWQKWYADPMFSNEKDIKIIRPYFLYLRGSSYEGINGILMQYSLAKLIKNLIRDNKYDMMLGYNMIPDGIATVRLAKKNKLPVGFWAIGTDVNDLSHCSRMNYYFSRKSIEGSQVIFTESENLEQKVRDLTNKTINVHTFYKGIDVNNFHNLPNKKIIKKELNMKDDNKYILFVGRIIYDKGIYELSETFNIISKKYSNYNLILIGEEIEKYKLETLFKKYGINNNVFFKGVIPYSRIAYYMRASDLMIFPSWAEGLPNVVMEAMATGLPVVTTNVGGIPEILENEVTGLSVPPKNVDKLAAATIQMIESNNLRETCIRNAKKLIHDKFDVKKNVVALYKHLESIQTTYQNN